MHANSLHSPIQKGCVYDYSQLPTEGRPPRFTSADEKLSVPPCWGSTKNFQMIRVQNAHVLWSHSSEWFSFMIWFGFVMAISDITLKVLCIVQHIKCHCALAPKLWLHSFRCHWSNIELGHKGETQSRGKKLAFNLMCASPPVAPLREAFNQ